MHQSINDIYLNNGKPFHLYPNNCLVRQLYLVREESINMNRKIDFGLSKKEIPKSLRRLS